MAYIGLGVFNDCAKLTEINVAPENAYYSSIDGVLFNRDKTTLVMYPKGKGDSYTVPDGVTTIGTYAFAWSDIADVTLPDSLTNIGPWAFICCYDLTKVTIPAHVTSLDIGAFHGCTSLSEIYFTGDAPEMYEHDINMDPEAYAASFKRVTATAYYPKDASGWEDVLTKDYTGPEGKLTWVAYDPDADDPTPPTPVSDIFQDITPNAWYTDAVQYVYDNGIMKGMGNGTFAPGESMTRAMVAQILYAQAGSPEVSGDIPFTDVPAGKWYSDAILWANQNDVVAGMGDGTFAPSANITRQEYAAILYRCEKSPAVSGSLDFPDANTVSGWATDAVLWATQNGIINGTANNGVTLLDPKGTATRAQSAVILKGYLEK